MCGIAATLSCSTCGSGAAAAACRALAPSVRRRGPDAPHGTTTVAVGPSTSATLLASVLHLRGLTPAAQPAICRATGSVLCWNGEVFGGLELGAYESDTPAVLELLCGAPSGLDMACALGRLAGPFAFCLARGSSLYFGRDPLGRRSLLLALAPDQRGAPLAAVLTSVGPSSERETGVDEARAMLRGSLRELPPLGVYELRVVGGNGSGVPAGDPCSQRGLPPILLAERALCCGQRTQLLRWAWPLGEAGGMLARAGLSARAQLPLVRAGAAPLPSFSDSHVGAAAVALLARLSESVRIRVQGAAVRSAPPTPLDVGCSLSLCSLASVAVCAAGCEPLASVALANLAALLQGGGMGSASVAEAGVCARVLPAFAPTFALHVVADGLLSAPAAATAAGAARGAPLHSTSPAAAGPPTGCAACEPAAGETIGSAASTASETTGSTVCKMATSKRAAAAGPLPPTATGARIAILFSGGLDSMLLARLAHEHAPAQEVVDLISVCFDAPAHASPDRLAAVAGVQELRRACPGRTWQLICVDESLDSALCASQHVAALLAPKGSHMDWNIGVALWYAARGVGWVDVALHWDAPGGGAQAELGTPRGLNPAKGARHLRYGGTLAAAVALPDGRHSLSLFDRRVALRQAEPSGAPPGAANEAPQGSPHSAAACSVPAGNFSAALNGRCYLPRVDETAGSSALPGAAGTSTHALTVAQLEALPESLQCVLASYKAEWPVQEAAASSYGECGGDDLCLVEPACEGETVEEDGFCAQTEGSAGPGGRASRECDAPGDALGEEVHRNGAVLAGGLVGALRVLADEVGGHVSPGCLQAAAVASEDRKASEDRMSSPLQPPVTPAPTKKHRHKPCAGVLLGGDACTAPGSGKCQRHMCAACCRLSPAGMSEEGAAQGRGLPAATRPCRVHGARTSDLPARANECSARIAGEEHRVLPQPHHAGADVAQHAAMADEVGVPRSTVPGLDSCSAAADLEDCTAAAGLSSSPAPPPPHTPAHSPAHVRVLTCSSASVLLLGIGADEQLAGYARHRTAFAGSGGNWHVLARVLVEDTARLWSRNLGRDDRVCSDASREPRFPYLDEGVMALLRSLPLPLAADLRLPHGVGDKRVLRVAACMAGIPSAAGLAKRAIHFGSRIAKASNVAAFGSNRAGRGAAAMGALGRLGG